MFPFLRCAALLAAVLIPATFGQVAVGDRLDLPELEGFTQIEAKTSQDLVGRAVLFEFFAFW
ncbi:MAG TPA: hypothetical protein PKA37_04520 [Planctomycetota bacterium]|jgi:hypothetical protein|nr:hypothetical protein [Planctomycetota bacterium]